MRFAYIDSNGNEVPIPSVDALALRIELGAITENTQLYDAQAEEWGPAHTHEIFHTLTRELDEKGFVAPPPVAPPVAPGGGDRQETEPVDVDEPDEPEGGDAKGAVDEPEGGEPEPVAEADSARESASAPEAETGVDAGAEPEAPDESFGLTLAEPQEPEGDEEPARQGTKKGASPSSPRPLGPDDDLPYLDLGDDEEDEEDTTDPSPSTEPAEDDAVFDFGGMEGDLEVEEPFEAPEDEAMDLSSDPAGGGGDMGGGMELETAMEFDSGGFEGGDDDSLDLETPMSDFTVGEPPSWMEDDAGVSDENVLDFSAAGTATEDSTTEVPLRDRRTPRTKPSPPKFKKQRNLAVPIIGVVVLLAVGLGGYVAWPIVSDRLTPPEETEEPGVTIPPLSEELMPVMREVSAEAVATIFQEARAVWNQSDSPPIPPSDWLAGAYLASAGDYPSAEAFWRGVADFVDLVRDMDLGTFDAALMEELSSRELSEADARAIRERADSGFVAAAPERAEVFEELDALIDAALALHQFLAANQDNIEYAPASIVTTDPVLEVEPATPEIEAAMNERLDDYFSAQRALDVRDRPSADVLLSLLQSRIQEEGVA